MAYLGHLYNFQILAIFYYFLSGYIIVFPGNPFMIKITDDFYKKR